MSNVASVFYVFIFCWQMYTPTYNVLNELLTAIDLNDGFKYLPRVWSGVY
jgi:hypothetical protein